VLGIAGLLATLALYRVGSTVANIGSGKTSGGARIDAAWRSE
jgi:hypothetical protein